MERDILKGSTGRTMRIFISLYPVFRRFQKDRKEAKRNSDEAWNYRRERNGMVAVERFIELGPTFIKLGQILSARPDLLPKEYVRSFEKLQDSVPPADFRLVRPIIEKEIGKIDEVFESFNPDAISGASLGQVYVARYNGKDVAVKVNRPDAEYIVKRDLVILGRILRFARGRIENFLYISISSIMKEFSVRVFEELDYRKEMSNANRIRKNIEGRERIIIPEVYEEISTSKVLVMDYVPGIKITDRKTLLEKNIDVKKLAMDLDTAFIRMLLRDDIFHADPHPGNISVLDDGTMVLYDFGMTGDLNDKTRYHLLSLYDAMTRGDVDQMADALIGVRALSPAANRGVIKRSMEIAMEGLAGKRAEDSEIRQLLEIADGVVFEFPFRLPTSLVLYMRMSSLLEGICLTLDPEFKFVKVLRKLFMDEGLFKELYAKQIGTFLEEAVRSVEAGVAILPLLKRELESREEARPPERKARLEMALAGGFVFIAGIYELRYQFLPGTFMIFAGIVLMAASMRKK